MSELNLIERQFDFNGDEIAQWYEQLAMYTPVATLFVAALGYALSFVPRERPTSTALSVALTGSSFRD